MDRYQKIALIIIIGFLVIISLIFIQTEERTRQYISENSLDISLPKSKFLLDRKLWTNGATVINNFS